MAHLVPFSQCQVSMHGVKSREAAKGNSDTIRMEGQGENDPYCITMGTIWEVWSGTGASSFPSSWILRADTYFLTRRTSHHLLHIYIQLQGNIDSTANKIFLNKFLNVEFVHTYIHHLYILLYIYTHRQMDNLHYP